MAISILEVDTIDPLSIPGVERKINAQIACFNSLGFSCQRKRISPSNSFRARIVRRIPFFPDGVSWREIPLTGFDAYYFRKPDMVTPDYLEVLNKIRISNPDARILIEIPTYPYDAEMRSFKDYPKLLRDRVGRNKLAGVVDRIVSMTQEEQIFGVPNISVFNGVDLTGLTARRVSSAADSINVACIASFSKWHGVDRVLEGLARYYDKSSTGRRREINLHLLGEGPALRGLFGLSKSLGLDGRVFFYGQCNRAEMDVIYNECSLAVECLGNHRKGISLSSSLKSREYLAKGIPFVYSGEIDVFLDEPVDFCLKVPADESPVDVEKLIEFHDALYAREPEEDLIARIRGYAERHVSMERAMANVIDYIKENCSGQE